MRPGDAKRDQIPSVEDLDEAIARVSSSFGPEGDGSGHDECAVCAMCRTCGDRECTEDV